MEDTKTVQQADEQIAEATRKRDVWQKVLNNLYQIRGMLVSREVDVKFMKDIGGAYESK